MIILKTVVFLFTIATSEPCFSASTVGPAIVSVGEIEATVRIEGGAAQTLFDSLDTAVEHQGPTAIKETRDIACFRYDENAPAPYTCVIFVFVNKDFVSTKSRYLQAPENASSR